MSEPWNVFKLKLAMTTISNTVLSQGFSFMISSCNENVSWKLCFHVRPCVLEFETLGVYEDDNGVMTMMIIDGKVHLYFTGGLWLRVRAFNFIIIAEMQMKGSFTKD